MFKKLFHLIIIVFAFGLVIGCSPSGKDAAKEYCNCAKKRIEVQKTGDQAAIEKADKEADECTKKIMEKYKDKEKDQVFSKDFEEELKACQKELEEIQKKIMEQKQNPDAKPNSDQKEPEKK